MQVKDGQFLLHLGLKSGGNPTTHSPCKKLASICMQQKVTLRLPLASREVQPAIIPLKYHLHIKRK